MSMAVPRFISAYIRSDFKDPGTRIHASVAQNASKCRVRYGDRITKVQYLHGQTSSAVMKRRVVTRIDAN